MGSEMQPTQAFQEKLFERIRDSMGDLMSDEDLKKLVEAAMHKAFFEERKVGGDSYGRHETKPSYLVEKIGEMLKQRADARIDAYMKDNAEIINAKIDEVISKGFLGIVHNYIERSASQPLQNFANDVRQRLGLPQVY